MKLMGETYIYMEFEFVVILIFLLSVCAYHLIVKLNKIDKSLKEIQWKSTKK